MVAVLASVEDHEIALPGLRPLLEDGGEKQPGAVGDRTT